MKKSIETVYYCSNCGSTDTSSMFWVNNFTDTIEDCVSDRRDEAYNFCNCCQQHVPVLNLVELWELFAETPVNENDELEESFMCFEAGTSKFDVWHWFDERCPNGLAVDLMGEQPKYPAR